MANLGQRLERALKARNTRYLRWSRGLKKLLSRRGNCVFVTAMPKSGSTFLVTAVAEATGYLPYFLGSDHLNEQDLYLPRLLDVWSLDVVCHQHTRATVPNLRLAAEFSIRPLVLVRDLGDALVSLCDHLEHESRVTAVFAATDDLLRMPRARRLEALVDLAAPWYISFFAGWAQADIDKLWLRYEELVADESDAVERVLDFYGIARAKEHVVAAVERAKSKATRFNVGIRGRGARELSTEQRARLSALARHYPTVDFSPIGLGDRVTWEPRQRQSAGRG